MEKLNKRDKRILVSNFVVVVLLGIVLMVLLNLTITVDEEGFSCLNDPLGYGAEKLTERNDAEFSCICHLAKENSPTIYFDSQGKNIQYPKSSSSNLISFEDFNLSEIVVVQE